MVLPGSSIGRYLVKRKLAEGGMAELYLCAAVGPEGFEKEVVIKRIKAFLSSDQGFIDMFKAEARLASRLNHANVVQIFDFDKHDDAWFIAMEYVYGASLWELRRRCRELAMPFPPILVAEIGAQVARGLHYAHTLSDKGKPLALVHRDVTPHNVLLSFDGGVKLTDFGIAKAGTSFTAPGMLKGKFAYMSPEQARGEKVDARTDVFAMGITLWEMLTGGRLFEGDSDIAVLRAVQESLIAAPARLNPDVPIELSEIVLKALARPLDQRFQSAHELDRALAHFVLKNSASTDDANVGLFLRQMFRDELEEAERAMNAEHQAAAPAPDAQTPAVDAYALGNTLQFKRNHDLPPTQMTATPKPEGSARPKTAQLPGMFRGARPAGTLLDPEDAGSKRTDQILEFVSGPGKAPTAPMPLRIQRKASEVAAAALTEPLPPLPSRSLSDELETASTANAPRKSLLVWVITACLAVGVIGGLTIAVQRSKGAKPAVVLPNPAPRPEKKPVEVVAAPAPLKAEVEVEVEVPAVKPEEPVAPEPKPVAEAAKAKGFLQVEAIPYGTLFINNKVFADIEGSRKIPLAPGTYALKFEHPKQVKSDSVTIKSGQTSVVKFHPLQR